MDSSSGNGVYTLSLTTPLLGNYDVRVIASDDSATGEYYNSQYLITTEHSFYVSPNIKPEETSGRYYIQQALWALEEIISEYDPSQSGYSLDKNTKRDITGAISLLKKAISYFESDGNHLVKKNGLKFYDNLTSAVNNIYTYLSDPQFGENIYEAIYNLKEGAYLIAVIVRNEAIEDGACQVSNCEELIKNANTEIGKALDESKQNNYVYVFNHLTNAWKFAMNVMGENLKKMIVDTDSENLTIPKEYRLGQNSPNPFNPSTKINFQLPEKKHVSLKIYDIQGNLVTTLMDKEMEAGYYHVSWDASRYATGIYFYRIMSGSFVSTKRLLFLK
jgi:hypothetical protein